MKKYAYLLYSCDEHHMKSSYKLLGVFSTNNLAVLKADVYSCDTNEPLQRDHVRDLRNHGQTVMRSENYRIEKEEVNKLIR